MHLIFRIYLLFVLCGSCSVTAAANDNTKQIALQIYFQDSFAFPKRSEDLFERIFKILRPELTYRRISIPDHKWNEERVRENLLAQIQNILKSGEELKVLIIDTHGGTLNAKDSGHKTTLRHIGEVESRGVDHQFNEALSPLLPYASEDLQIILNSCSVFCGPSESVALRAKVILDFFGAENGSIYGSYVPEVSHEFDRKRFFKWSYLIPDLKQVITVASVTSALMFPAMLLDEPATQAAFSSVTLGAGLGALLTGFIPAFKFLSSKFFFNRGYFFRFKNGELEQGIPIDKNKNLEELISDQLLPLNCNTLLKSPL